jgi:hypothetical protein
MCLIVFLGLFVFPWATPAAAQGTVVTCPFSGSGGDLIERGFYVSNYPGTNIRSVTLRYSAFVEGTYLIALNAHLGSYDGPVIGAAYGQATLTGGLVQEEVVFQFGGAPVPTGSTIAFTQNGGGPSALFYDIGLGGLGDPSFAGCPGVVETEGTTPPLDEFRRGSVGVIITEAPTPAQAHTRTLRFARPVRIDTDTSATRKVDFGTTFTDIASLCVTFVFEKDLLDAGDFLEYAWGSGGAYGFLNAGPDPQRERTSCLIPGHPELALLMDGREVLTFDMSAGSVGVREVAVTITGVAAS